MNAIHILRIIINAIRILKIIINLYYPNIDYKDSLELKNVR